MNMHYWKGNGFAVDFLLINFHQRKLWFLEVCKFMENKGRDTLVVSRTVIKT